MARLGIQTSEASVCAKLICRDPLLIAKPQSASMIVIASTQDNDLGLYVVIA